MPDRPPRRPGCGSTCSILASHISYDHPDAPVPLDHFDCVWRQYQGRVRSRVRAELSKLPLGSLSGRLTAANPEIKRPGVRAVQNALARDESLIEDLCQEIGIAFWQSVTRGRVRAAIAVINAWFATTTRLIVRRKARSAALLALVASPEEDETFDEDAPGHPIVFNAPVNEADAGLAAEDRNVLVQQLELLTESERDALLSWADGYTSIEAAELLGTTAGAVRLRLLRARQHLARAFRAA